MDRVVTAIDHGNCPVICDGVQDAIFFLVFELAQCDIRSHVVEAHRANDVWRMSALHHLAIAIQQLHGGGVCHNDIKPANFLVIDASLQKLADLGQATSDLHRASHEERHDIGDPTYAAPEFLYAQTPQDRVALCDKLRRQASDLYQLGSIANYLFTGRMITPDVVSRLEAVHQPPINSHGWGGGYDALLPFWRAAFNETILQLEQAITLDREEREANLLSAVVVAVQQLSEPDPRLRGHPANRTGHQSPLDLQRYVSLFDALRSRLMIKR
jgi:serine/threonine protein kinase